MALGRKKAKQTSMWVAGSKLQRGPRHVFYERLEEVLVGADFDGRTEALCARFYEDAGRPGRPSVPPGVYFRMLLVGYFEGI
ncbi:MAG: DDE transposase, partial [Gemmatimonadota bacterium]